MEPPPDVTEAATPTQPSFREYSRWLSDQRAVELSDAVKNRYESVVAKLKADFERSPYWGEAVSSLGRFDDEYKVARNNYALLMPWDDPPVVQTKPYRSFVEKTFRKNVIDNGNWPDAPPGGWLLPDRCYDRINDLVRTTISVRYLDGVSFLADRLETVAGKHSTPFTLDLEARMEGYYAGHIYTRHEVDIPGAKWDTERITATFEIHVTTQLQEVIRRLLHTYYESRRQAKGDDAEGWEWDYETDEFSANYLGHILHYVEGMIMEIRQRQAGS